MFQHGRKLLFGALFFSSDKETPQSVSERELEKRLEEFEAAAPSSGWERVKYILFREDEYGDSSAQAEHIRLSTLSAAILAGFYGGVKKGQEALVEFQRTNQATKFDSHMEAKRRLQDRISINFLKGAYQLGWRTGLFVFLFTSIQTGVSLYRNKEGILEYSAGGTAAGMAYRFHMGMRGIVVGGILGVTLGTVAGIMTTCTVALTGISMNDVKHAQYLFLKNRESLWKRSIQEGASQENDQMSENQLSIDKISSDEEKGHILDTLESIETEEKRDTQAETINKNNT